MELPNPWRVQNKFEEPSENTMAHNYQIELRSARTIGGFIWTEIELED